MILGKIRHAIWIAALRVAVFGAILSAGLQVGARMPERAAWREEHTDVAAARPASAATVVSVANVASVQRIKRDAGEEPAVLAAALGQRFSAEEAEEAPSHTELPTVCGYCGNPEHSYDRCARRSVDGGALGRWVIPDIGINVACYYENYDYALMQRITDAVDSACCLDELVRRPGYDMYVIADHDYQGFWALKNASIGMNAYMDYGDFREEYICTQAEKGYNCGDHLSDADHTPLYSDHCPDGILCYTCNGNSHDIILVPFQPISR